MAERQLEIVESEGFTVVYNDLIQDSRLRLQTRAVLVLMLSKPKNWDFSVRGMAAIAGVTKDTMARMLNELIEAGYVQRKEQSREGGKFGKGGFMVSGRPQFAVPEPAAGGTAAGAAARAAGFIPASEYEMKGVPDANQRSVCGGEKVPAKLERSELSGSRQLPVGVADPCPDFSYTNPSYAKNSPQQNKEQENTKQEQHNPPKSPLWAERKARERHFDPALESAVLSWLRYKSERGEMYKPTGLQTLLTRIENKASAFGAAAVVDIIEQSMSANWQGIVWDKLKKSAPAAPVRRFWE